MFDLGARHALFGELAVVVGVCAAHMSMPNHWLPYALMGIGQGWPLRRALLISTSSTRRLRPDVRS